MTIRTKRRICEAAGWLCWLGVYAVLNNQDAGTISIGAGAAVGFILLALGAGCLYKAGVLRI